MLCRTPKPLACLLAAAAALVGCGASGRHGPSDEQQVRTTVTAFASASGSHDYARLCGDVLSTRLVERIQRSGATCAEVMQQLLQGVRNPRVDIQGITVARTTAKARVRSTAEGQAPSEDTLELVRERAGWRIAALGRAR